ncbi:hypothetical protein OQZ33_13380 [Pedobacter sp. MC2016-05]|nr:hypothetical protein [Pedobacter sp. MC2016-05]MCX2475323.1 hypothetical protein [Pedobacter sp. MC2016-05]
MAARVNNYWFSDGNGNYLGFIFNVIESAQTFGIDEAYTSALKEEYGAKS